MTFGEWFLVVWFVLLVAALTSFVVRRRRESPTRDVVHGQPVIFATRAVVLIHARGSQGSGWGFMKGAGGAQLVVHSDGLEVTIGAWDGLVSGNTMLIVGAAMRRERLSVWPVIAGNRECIRLWGDDGTGPREWKVSPRGTPIDEVWDHLIAAGVTPAN
jgi:hypothetical protein